LITVVFIARKRMPAGEPRTTVTTPIAKEARIMASKQMLKARIQEQPTWRGLMTNRSL
jgi:hypothetical protein